MKVVIDNQNLFLTLLKIIPTMYKEKENKEETSEVKEPITAYQRTIHPENVHVMSLEQALKNGMPLEESKRIMMDKIHKDFPEYQF